ncbi:Vps51/Vps67-domain-containing protein [Pleurostoma richardsiae]|uniref:Vacuolar protein sorting-associated protein 51 homolog n=1 Tax=Pleurostoma richardsiae TaxID=41990 RepID=A0AA38RHW9_9PEZI|nr:Vps51/Vps67-domain-containing protein [Pleurostoma richardsiae]
MSTIASPRDPSTPLPPRRISTQAVTPTSSSRPSLDLPRSASGSPNPNTSTTPSASSTHPAAAGSHSKRSNRAALREYYNLKKAAAASSSAGAGAGAGGAALPLVEVTDPLGHQEPSSYSEVPASELDAPGFDAEAYVAARLRESGMEELLRTYTRVLGEVRALDAEKKALVYDNYSKLISATETIRKMRANMDPLNPMASTLDPAIAQIYSQASSIRETLRQSVPKPEEKKQEDDADTTARRTRTRELAIAALEAPDRIRKLVREGKAEEARREWELPRKLLDAWKEKGLGGGDVDACIADGEAALRGEDSPGGWDNGLSRLT